VLGPQDGGGSGSISGGHRGPLGAIPADCRRPGLHVNNSYPLCTLVGPRARPATALDAPGRIGGPPRLELLLVRRDRQGSTRPAAPARPAGPGSATSGALGRLRGPCRDTPNAPDTPPTLHQHSTSRLPNRPPLYPATAGNALFSRVFGTPAVAGDSGKNTSRQTENPGVGGSTPPLSTGRKPRRTLDLGYLPAVGRAACRSPEIRYTTGSG